MAAFRIYPPAARPLPTGVGPTPLARATPYANEWGHSSTFLELDPRFANSSYELYANHDLRTYASSRTDIAIKERRFAAALELIEEDIAAYIGRPLRLAQCYNRQAFIYCRMRLFHKAEESIEMAIRLFEREGLKARAADYYERSLVRHRRQHLYGALDDINTALCILTRQHVALPANYLFHKASLLNQLQAYRGAREVILTAIERTQDKTPARYFALAAKILRNCHYTEKALEMINYALVKEGEHPFPETHLERSRILVELQRYEDALDEINFAIQLEGWKPLPKTLRQQAVILGCLERWKEAEEVITRLLDQEGSSPDPQTTREWLRIKAAQRREA